ncbi:MULTISPECIES: hypothetical protein [unclassified Blastococcus]
MSWPVLVLLLTAGALSTAGAVAVHGAQRPASEESRARRSIAGFSLLAVAAAVAAVAGGVMGAGAAGPSLARAFAAAAAAVALPVLVVVLARGVRPAGRTRPARVDR